MSDDALLPSEVDAHVGLFDRFAGWFAGVSGRAAAFVGAVLIIVVWAFTGPLLGFSDTWQLIINTLTTLITFCMVFVIQNTQNRSDQATQQKLNAVADALSDFLDVLAADHPDLARHAAELRSAVGLERRTSTS